MREKTYQGRTMKEALARVRKDLGGDAVILASREVRRRRPLGLGPRELIQITAAAAMPSAPSEAASRSRTIAETLRRIGRNPHQDLLELPPLLVSGYAQLLDAEVPDALARAVVRHAAESLDPGQVSDPRAVHEALCQTIGECVAVAPPCGTVAGTRRIIALVGPTGVGKTTIGAKLAAGFKLAQGVRTGLLTVDMYRIAAVEQLKTYANLIEVPLAVVEDPSRMRPAIDGLGPVDIIFLDTAGRSPRDESKIRELEPFLAEARPDEVHLVLSATAAERTLQWTIDRFASLGVDRLILTKLDEAGSIGPVLGVLGRGNLPVSYITTGQGVPEDIEPADRRRLARCVLGLEQVGRPAPNDSDHVLVHLRQTLHKKGGSA